MPRAVNLTTFFTSITTGVVEADSMTAGATVTAAAVVEATWSPCTAVFVSKVELTIKLASMCFLISDYIREHCRFSLHVDAELIPSVPFPGD